MPQDPPAFGDLGGHVAIVTGAAGGIGLAVALELGDAGCRLVVNDRLADGVERAVHRLEAAGHGALGAPGDVSTREGATGVVRRTVEEVGDPTILVNVAGGMRGAISRRFVDIDDAQWDFAMKVNVRTTYQCMRAALEVMIPRRSGRIVNIASTSWAGSAAHADYAAAKAAVVALTRSVATEVGPSGVTVNAVAPGLTLTDAVRAMPEAFDTVPAPPLGRYNECADVAAAVRFLCSDAARNVSGHLVTVAGGWNPSL